MGSEIERVDTCPKCKGTGLVSGLTCKMCLGRGSIPYVQEDHRALTGIVNTTNPLSANERQVGGSHYKSADGGEEHWDRVARLKLDYFQACTTKYIERWKKKNGLEDLKKAQHYLQKYIELIEANGGKPLENTEKVDESF